MSFKKSLTVCLLLIFTTIFYTSFSELNAKEGFSLYLVRHAEKAKSPKKDPELTEQGHMTARAFADYLQDKQITRVFSTDYKRTMQTAEHFSGSRRMLIQKYKPNELDAFAKLLLKRGDTSYVVGHSNTTPTLIALLGGIATPIADHEYGQIYHLFFNGDNVTTSVVSVKD